MAVLAVVTVVVVAVEKGGVEMPGGLHSTGEVGGKHAGRQGGRQVGMGGWMEVERMGWRQQARVDGWRQGGREGDGEDVRGEVEGQGG